MKVYVLTADGGETLEGVFSTREKAFEANEILDIAGTVEEVEIDEIRIERWDGGIGTKRVEVRKL